MKIFFDASVLVAAVVDQLPQLPQHTRAFAVFANRRIQLHEAWQIIEKNFTKKFTILDLKRSLYLKTLKRP